MLNGNSILVLFLMWSTFALAQGVDQRLQNTLDEIYESKPTSVGLMVHVESPMLDLSWSGTSGYADIEKAERLTTDRPALIASSIKTYMAAAILRLVEEGKFNLETPIEHLISEQSRAAFSADGYDLEAIQVQHLLSHTSGIYNYADMSYIQFADSFPDHRWTRDEQLARSLQKGDPLGKPGTLFQYADANYLLLGEIMEGQMDMSFYAALAELLRFDELGLEHTWFPTLEEKPKDTPELAHQYWTQRGWDSYKLDISFDLFGGGGIACPPSELAQFVYHYFNGDIVKGSEVRDLIFTHVKTKGTELHPYYLGLSRAMHSDLVGYGHGGFWGTVMMYFPAIDTAVAVYVLDRDEGALRGDILDEVTAILVEEIQVKLSESK